MRRTILAVLILCTLLIASVGAQNRVSTESNGVFAVTLAGQDKILRQNDSTTTEQIQSVSGNTEVLVIGQNYDRSWYKVQLPDQ